MQTHQIVLFVCIGLGMFAVIGGLALLSNYYTLNGIKSRTVGDGQHGTARFATEKEIRETYAHTDAEAIFKGMFTAHQHTLNVIPQMLIVIICWTVV